MLLGETDWTAAVAAIVIGLPFTTGVFMLCLKALLAGVAAFKRRNGNGCEPRAKPDSDAFTKTEQKDRTAAAVQMGQVQTELSNLKGWLDGHERRDSERFAHLEEIATKTLNDVGEIKGLLKQTRGGA